MKVELASDISHLIGDILQTISFPHVKVKHVICVRSFNSKSRARARIWSFPKIWQFALRLAPYYIIEVLSQHFDSLSTDDKIRVLIHELMHIPKNFSGALVPHRGRFSQINRRSVEKLFTLYKNSKPA